MGRFINKDPIEEQGGLNLYGFCFNNAVNAWDVLGMGVDGAGNYDIFEADGGGGRDNLGFDTSGGRSAPTVNNPAEAAATARRNLIHELRKNGATPQEAIQLANAITNQGFAAVFAAASLVESAVAADPATSASASSGTNTQSSPGDATKEVNLRLAFEGGVANVQFAADQINNMQEVIDNYTNATGQPSVHVRATFSKIAVPAPAGGAWVIGKGYNDLVKAIGGEVKGYGIIFASSPVVSADPPPFRRDLAGFNASGFGAVVSLNAAGPYTTAHEFGHVLGLPHAGIPDTLNVMHGPSPWPLPGESAYIDADYYNNLKKVVRRKTP